MIRVTSIRTGLLLASLLMLTGCTVSRADVERLKPHSTFTGGLPVNATLLVRVPLREQRARINVRDGYGNIHVLSVGADLREASLSVSRRYFSSVAPFSPEARAQYILSVAGDAQLDVVNGYYTAKLDAALYATDGRLLYKAQVEGTALSGRINDGNAFFNAYVEATQAFLDNALSEAGSKLLADAAEQPAQQVLTFVYPRLTALAQSPTLIMGTVRAPTNNAADAKPGVLSISLPDGARGGPVLDTFGRVIGVLRNAADVARETSPTSRPQQNLHYFARSSALRQLLDANSIDYARAPSPAAPAQMTDIAANANGALVLIICTE